MSPIQNGSGCPESASSVSRSDPYAETRGDQPDDDRKAREHEPFDEELTDDTRATRPERAPHGDFGLASGRARERQQRHVGTDEHQEHHDEDVPEHQPPLEPPGSKNSQAYGTS